jgi:hypothetical protein
MIKHKCETCGKEFESQYQRQKYCSKECYEVAAKKARAKYAKTHTSHEVICEYCGKSFNTSFSYTACRNCQALAKAGFALRKQKSYAQIRAQKLANPLKNEYRGQRCSGYTRAAKPCLILPTTEGEN